MPNNNDDKKANDSLVRHYERYLRLERGYSQNTILAYMHDIDHLLRYLHSASLHVVDVKLEDLENFVATLVDVGISPKSQARILSGIRSFYRYLVLDGYLDKDPTELLESPNLGEHLPEVLSTKEVDMIEDAINLEKWE